MSEYRKSKEICGARNSTKRTVKRLKRERRRIIRRTGIEEDIDIVIKKSKGSRDII